MGAAEMLTGIARPPLGTPRSVVTHRAGSLEAVRVVRGWGAQERRQREYRERARAVEELAAIKREERRERYEERWRRWRQGK